MSTALPSLDREAIAAAATRIRPHVRTTPVWQLPLTTLLESSRAASDLADLAATVTVTLKLEQLQVSGSFKARGMFNRLLANPIPQAGVIVASGGNAGIATAAAALRLGVPCEVFVPTISSPAKQAALKALGARLHVTGSAYADALEACLKREVETGALLTHAYDQAEVVTGAGTLGLELEQQIKALPESKAIDAVLVSVGGGGLAAGLAAWYAQTSTRLIALEPSLAPTLASALHAGAPVDVDVSGIAADSLGARRLGALAWQLLGTTSQSRSRSQSALSVLLSDEAINEARSWLWRNLHLAVEPAAALPLAALRSGAYQPRRGEHLALIICGANTDTTTLT